MDTAIAASLIQPPPTFLVVATAIVLTAFAILIALLILAWMVRDWRQSKPKRPPERGPAPYRPPLEPSPRSHFAPPPPRREVGPYRSAPVSYTAPRQVPPSIATAAAPCPAPMQSGSTSGFGAGGGFLNGLAVGALLDTALRDEPAYVPTLTYDPPSHDTAPPPTDSGITYDSGSSGSDSSSSGDSGSSGSISFDW